jgi:glyoxylase-like metal-dependent hydrolase (beta-lactamase superfamily II)
MHWKVGEVAVTKIVEQEMPGLMEQILPITPETIGAAPWLRPHFVNDDGQTVTSIHALVIQTPTRRILVDTCVGNDKARGHYPFWNELQTGFLSDLETAGFPRESIDTVVCTHLHVDHVGWNTMRVNGRWQPTFPRARYLFGKAEFAHWSQPLEAGEIPAEFVETQAAVFGDSVKPVADAGLVDLVETDHKITPEVSLVPTLGHTPGHVSVRISSAGQEALVTGDFIHHPIQLAHPGWATTVDADPAQANETRARMFAALAGTRTLVIGTHWAGATAGRIVRDGNAYRLEV